MSAPQDTPAGQKPRRFRWLDRLLGPGLSPHGLLSRAALLAMVFAVMHLAGLREYTTIISGTSPTGDTRDWVAALIGVFYILFYMAFTMLVPMLLIAAGLLALGFALPAGSRENQNAD